MCKGLYNFSSGHEYVSEFFSKGTGIGNLQLFFEALQLQGDVTEDTLNMYLFAGEEKTTVREKRSADKGDTKK